MKTFSLDQYSSHFPDDLLAMADLSLEMVSVITEGDQDPWKIHFGVPFEHEIEILIEKDKVVSCLCDCELFHYNHICFHIIAAIKEISNIKKSENKQKERSKASLRIHLTSLLRQLSEEELKDFILQYCRADNRMAHALKSRFAYKINTHDNRQKYLNLISQFAGVKRTENLNHLDLKRLGLYCENLLALSDDLRSLQNLPESYSILSALLFFLNYRSLSFRSDLLERVTIEIHNRINFFLNRDAAPEFKQFIFNDIALMLTESDYWIPPGKVNLFRLLLDWKNFHSFEQLAFEKLYCNVTLRVSQSLRTELIFLEWCLETGLSQEIQAINRVFHNRPEFVDLCQKTFVETESMIKLLPVLQAVYSETPNKITQHKCFTLIEAFYLDRHDTKLLDLRLDFLISQPEIDLFLSLKEMKTGRWPAIKKEIIDALERMGRREDLAKIYSWDGDHKGLLEHIRITGSLSLLNQHVHLTYMHYPHQTVSLYKEFLAKYLSEHIGPRSTLQVNEVIKILNRYGFKEAVKEIKHFLNDKFEERTLTMGIKTV